MMNIVKPAPPGAYDLGYQPCAFSRNGRGELEELCRFQVPLLTKSSSLIWPRPAGAGLAISIDFKLGCSRHKFG